MNSENNYNKMKRRTKEYVKKNLRLDGKKMCYDIESEYGKIIMKTLTRIFEDGYLWGWKDSHENEKKIKENFNRKNR